MACSSSSGSGGAGGQGGAPTTTQSGTTNGTASQASTTEASSSNAGPTASSASLVAAASSSSASGQGGAGGGLPTPETNCADNVDNDGDSFIDCDDPDCVGTAVCADLVINEIDYNQLGTDTAEFVEIFNASNATASMSGVSLQFIDGSTVPPSVYGSVDLSGQTLLPNHYLVVADPSVNVAAGSTKVDMGAVIIQNGAPDGVVIFDGHSQTVIDALAYQGAIHDADIGGQSFDLVHGSATNEADRDPAPNISMVRFPNGTQSGDDSVDWTVTPVVTPGAANLLGEICNNLIDDDGDNLVDCADPDCSSAPNCVEICNDGIDNNANSLIDCQESTCNNKPCAANGKRCATTTCSCPGGATEVTCGDQVDNDCDGLVDCADPDCTGSPACAENCLDHIDNNNNSLIDCADPLCATKVCGANGLSCSGTACICPGGATETSCGDNFDNDCDGLKDCMDPDCATATVCMPGVLIFSEYVEGTGNRKAMEIFNVSGGPQDLSQCVMHRYSNGSTFASATIALAGTLPVGATFTICNALGVTPTDPSGIPAAVCNLTNAAINHNGNDSYDLVCGGVYQDFFGELSTGEVPPATAVADFAPNQTLRRNCNVTVGKNTSSQMFDGTQWSNPPLAVDTFGGLGQRTCPNNP